jgi:hypothetical protein
VPTSPHRRQARLAASVTLVALVLTACGRDESPAESVPELSHRLEQVDAAIVDGEPDRAREAVDALLDEAAQARVDGDLTADQADRILRAATELLRALPEDSTDAPPSTDPSLEPPETGQEDDSSDEGGGSGEDGDRKGGNGKGDDEGKGPPEGNGRDD